MKRSLLLFCILIQGCAITGLSREEGLYLESSENQARYKTELGVIYSSANKEGPGNKVLYIGGMSVTTNCHRTKPVSVMISPIIPLPPIIPFPLSTKPHEENLEIYISSSYIDPKEISIDVDGIEYKPMSDSDYKHTFNIYCPSLANKNVFLKFGKLKKKIRLIYKSEFQLVFGYMGA